MPPCAPIALFLYNRPDHARRMIESLMRCDGFADSDVYVFSDGPRDAAAKILVADVRRTARALLGPHRVTFRDADTNLGLSRSIISGASEICEAHGRAIVIEDDLVLHQSFLRYMNQSLDHYRNVDQVMQVSGYMYPVPEFRARREIVLLPFISSWGWATWLRAWKHFDPRARGWEALARDGALRRRFDLDGNFDYSLMLERQMTGASDSWAIRWYWSVFTKGGLAAYPPQSLVSNEGFDGSGTHGWHAARSSYKAQGSSQLAADGETTFPRETRVRNDDFLAVTRVIGRTRRGLAPLLRRVRTAVSRLVSRTKVTS